MSWIKEINEENAEGKLKELYEAIGSKRGKLSNIMKVHSLNPEAMEGHLDLYMTLMYNSTSLTREESELIGVVVSRTNNCDYCVNHHAIALNHYWRNDDKIEKLITVPRKVSFGDKQRALIDYCIKLTEEPSKIEKGDIVSVREAGYTDEDILNINLTACYYNFVNRIALGLGVSYSSKEMSGYKY